MATRRTSYSPDQFNQAFELAIGKSIPNNHTGLNLLNVVGQKQFVHFFVKKRTVDQQYQLRGTILEDSQVWVIRHNKLVHDYQYLIANGTNWQVISDSIDDGNYYDTYDFLTVKKVKGSGSNG